MPETPAGNHPRTRVRQGCAGNAPRSGASRGPSARENAEYHEAHAARYAQGTRRTHTVNGSRARTASQHGSGRRGARVSAANSAVEAPKRKKRRHVLFVAEDSSRLADKIKRSEKITNSELRRTLAAYRGEVQPDQEG